jgi:hypothetical protein
MGVLPRERTMQEQKNDKEILRQLGKRTMIHLTKEKEP